MIDPSVEAKRLRDAFASRSIVPAPSTLDAGFDLDTAYAIEGKIGYLVDPKLKGQDPGPFRIIAIPLKGEVKP